MANKLADARQSLLRAREAAQKRLQELDRERRETKASLKSLDAALAALDKSYRTRIRSRTADDQLSRPHRTAIFHRFSPPALTAD